MASGSGWILRRFDQHLDRLGDLTPTAVEELTRWLALLTQNPAAVPRTQVDLGTHIGETLPEPEREEPFPPFFHSWIPAGGGRALRCAYFVRPDERVVDCIAITWD